MYRYKIKYHSDFYKKVVTDKGFVYGENYSDAVARLVDYYGERETIEFFIWATESDCGVIADECAKEIQKIEESEKN